MRNAEMTKKQNEPADAATNLEATRFVRVTNTEETQIVPPEALEEMEYIRSLSAGASASKAGSRSIGRPGAVLALILVAAAIGAALLGARIPQRMHPQTISLPAAQTVKSENR